MHLPRRLALCAAARRALGTKARPSVTLKASSAGLPDFIEHWSRDAFYKVGAGGVGLTVACGILAGPFQPATVGLAVLTAAYWRRGLLDIQQKEQSIKRNFPVLGHVRYVLESLRPEIRQYFVEGDEEAAPFDRLHRATIYQRAKGAPSALPFGTRRDVYDEKYEWATHSLFPTELQEQRIVIGATNPACTQPYSSSLLNISAMSYGALSEQAILALSTGAEIGDFSHNTGEGGISRFHIEGGGALVWNIGTGYFGCGTGGMKRSFDADMFSQNVKHASMVEIKLSQGAKPAHGGMLPKSKITKEIAEARNLAFPATEDCNSPPRHSAFNTMDELCDFIQKLRTLSDGKPIGVKMCVGKPSELARMIYGFQATGVHPDFITIDGGEGGTGAAPPEFSNSIGMPLADALTLTHALLVGAGLRDPLDRSKSRVALIASGKISTGFAMFKAFAMGADVCNAARPFLFSLGCIQALKCHTNKCPTGITTQDPMLSFGLDPTLKATRVARFHRETVHACVEVVQACGLDSVRDVRPNHVMRRIASNSCAPLDVLYPHLTVRQGELLKSAGPAELQRLWDHR